MADTTLNQLPGHQARIEDWKNSPEGKAYLAAEDERQEAYEQELKAYKASVEQEAGPAEAEADFSESDGAPNKSDAKSDWVDYAVSQGADPDEAEESTKDELIAAYGD